LKLLSRFQATAPVLGLAATYSFIRTVPDPLNARTDRLLTTTARPPHPRFSAGLKPGQIEIVPTNNVGSVDVKDGVIRIG
jgi:hypothetical protein